MEKAASRSVVEEDNVTVKGVLCGEFGVLTDLGAEAEQQAQDQSNSRDDALCAKEYQLREEILWLQDSLNG